MAESLRAEARRRGLTVYRIRLQRGEQRGYTPGQSVGKVKNRNELITFKELKTELDYARSLPRRGLERRKRMDDLIRKTRQAAKRMNISEHDAWSTLMSSPPKPSSV